MCECGACDDTLISTADILANAARAARGQKINKQLIQCVLVSNVHAWVVRNVPNLPYSLYFEDINKCRHCDFNQRTVAINTGKVCVGESGLFL